MTLENEKREGESKQGNTAAGVGSVARTHGEEFATESVRDVMGGEGGGSGHITGRDVLAEVKVWKISINCGLFAGSCFQHSSRTSQMGSGISVHEGRSGLFPSVTKSLVK